MAVVVVLLLLAGCSSGTPMEAAQGRMDAASAKMAGTIRASLKGTPWDQKVAGLTMDATGASVWVRGTVGPAEASDLASTVAQELATRSGGTWLVEVLDPGGARLAVRWSTTP